MRSPASGFHGHAFWVLVAALSLCAVATRVWATAPCDQWSGHQNQNLYTGPWETDPNAAAADITAWCVANIHTCISPACTPLVCQNVQGVAVLSGVFPAFHPVVTYLSCNQFGQNCGKQQASDLGILERSNPGGCGMFVVGNSDAKSQCHSVCVADPINPTNGEVFSTESDLSKGTSALQFRRFYDSTITVSGDLGPGWRHSYSRSIKPRNASSLTIPYVPGTLTSSLYNDESTACISGFGEIKSKVSAWASATASYASGQCTLRVGTTVVGVLPIYYLSQPTPASTFAIAYDATRDDGQLVSFVVSGSSVTPPPGIAMALQPVAGGYTLTDENDNVEAYDTNGRLLSVTSRAGVVQTVGYDGSGRLITVTDSFGNQLVVSYDTTGRVSQVVQQ